MDATPLKKRVKVTLEQAVKFHLLTELTFFRSLLLIPADLDLLTLLALGGEVELPGFCATAARYLNPRCPLPQLGTREQNVRNRLVKLERRGLVHKHRPGPKTLVSLAPDLQIPLGGNVLLDYQLLGVAPVLA